MANVIQSIKEDLQEFDIKVDNDGLIDKMYEVALRCGVDSGEVACEWIAFSTENDFLALSSENIDKWDSKLTGARRPKKKIDFTQDTQISRRYDESTLSDLFGVDNEGLINTYGTPEDKQQLSIKRNNDHLTSSMPTTKRPSHTNGYKSSTIKSPMSSQQLNSGSFMTTPKSKFTPSVNSIPFNGSFSSPSVSTPAVRYVQRTNSGDEVCCLNKASLPSSWRGNSKSRPPRIVHYDEDNTLVKPYNFMYQTNSAKSTELNDYVEQMVSLICKAHGLSDPSSLATVSLEPTIYAGRVVSDCVNGGHMNASSVLLEGTRRTSQGRLVRLNLSQVKNYSLFPGQIIVVEGNNCSDLTLMATKIYGAVNLERPYREFSSTPAFTMVVAAGPFTTSDSLDMDPLSDLLRVVSTETPDILVLCGPFVDADHKIIKDGTLTQTHQQFFESSVLHRLRQVDSKHTQVVVLPSLRDVHHTPVYPQPPFITTSEHNKASHGISFMSDPCVLVVNGIVMGMTSTDIIKHLSGQEAYQCEEASSDRMARLASHLLDQQSFYPLYPSHEGVGMDISRALQYCRLPVRPDILLLPSELRPFNKVVKNTLCVNPGHITKGEVGGTYAKLHISAGTLTDLHTHIGVQVLRI
ncbi:DNA polymerase alpha subunit B-like [Dysidea avara]|uniref:DNA polymerase alpha subunit B-like n=1 Tax=Dysidea avara TaxID=196820 RepID=UPI00332673F0